MSCTCLLRDRSLWRVVMRTYHRSAFSGGRMISSAYSLVRCLSCGHFWRTRAKYVDLLADATYKESTQP